MDRGNKKKEGDMERERKMVGRVKEGWDTYKYESVTWVSLRNGDIEFFFRPRMNLNRVLSDIKGEKLID